MQNAVKVIAKDLDRAVKSNSRSTLLTTLSMIFNPARLFYQKVRFARQQHKTTKTNENKESSENNENNKSSKKYKV